MTQKKLGLIICIAILTLTLLAGATNADITSTQPLIFDGSQTNFILQNFEHTATVEFTVISGSLVGSGTFTDESTSGNFAFTPSSNCIVAVVLSNAFTSVSGIYQTNAIITFTSGATQTFTWVYTIPDPPSPTPTVAPTAIPTLPPPIPANQVWLYVNQTGQGTTNPTAGYHFYNSGTSVALHAVPASGWAFNYWLLDNGTQITVPSASLIMDTNHTAMAVFQEIPVEGEPTPAPTVAPTPIPTTPPDYPDVINVQPFWNYLVNGNFLGLVNALFLSVFQLQSIVVAVFLLVFFAPLFIKTRNLLLCSILWILIGGSFIALVPDLAGLAVILLILGVASLLYKLVRPN